MYGTQLLNKFYEGSTGILSVGLYLEQLVGRSGLIFLRSDDKNFFALEVNGENKGDIRLVQVVEGAAAVL